MKGVFAGLRKTRERMSATDDWRDRLILADVGAATAAEIAREAAERAAQNGGGDPGAAIVKIAARRLRRLEAMLATAGRRPFVILVLGVNGCGKTTTIAKLARRLMAENKSVLLAAGDTFRAAAREQLQKWATALGDLEIMGGEGDPAAIAYNAAAAGAAKNVDVVLIDTAGRLPSRKNLMAELGKIRRAVGKALPGAPHELLLVLDATTGQNALAQIGAFAEAVGVSGVIVSKLDGSAKGGFLLAMAAAAPAPVRFVGVGEGGDDLALFNADDYAAALLGGAVAA